VAGENPHATGLEDLEPGSLVNFNNDVASDFTVANFEKGTTGGRPVVGIADRYYYDVDKNILYRDNGTTWIVMNATLTMSITIEDPAADEDISMFFTTVAITVTQLTAVIRGTTSVTYNIEWGDTRDAADDTVADAGIVANSSTGGVITTSFGVGDAIPADSFVWLTTSALADTPAELNVTIEYTED
jgi:hypothetical protein